MRIYLDHNAGAPVRPEAFEAAAEAMRAGGNPSSVHQEGRAARRRIEAARAPVARLAGATPGGVVFTSGATEANVTALQRVWGTGSRQIRFDRLYVSAVEHPSVLKGGQFPPDLVRTVPVDCEGIVRIATLRETIEAGQNEGGSFLVAIQLANGETGVIQPIAELAAYVRGAGGRLHCDAVQAAGRLPLDLASLGADSIALSAHKLGGLQGAGALVLADPDFAPAPLLPGGGQEANRRGGTENGPAIAAFGAAAASALADLGRMDALRARRDWLEGALRPICGEMTIIGAGADRLANTLAFAVPGVAAETAVIAFDLEGVAISAGSACSSGKVSASTVLRAMGLADDLARGGLRISLGWSTTGDDVERFVEIARKVMPRLRTSRSGRAA